MVKLNVKVNIDPKAITKRIMDSADKALPQLTEEIVKDCNMYAPERYGGLTGSSVLHLTASRQPEISFDKANHKATIRWGVPYASYVFKGISKSGKPLKYNRVQKPTAGSHWTRRAKQIHVMDWKTHMEKLIKNHYKNNGGN